MLKKRLALFAQALIQSLIFISFFCGCSFFAFAQNDFTEMLKNLDERQGQLNNSIVNSPELLKKWTTINSVLSKGTLVEVEEFIKSKDVNEVIFCSTMLTTLITSLIQGNPFPELVSEKVSLLLKAGADVNKIPCPNKATLPPLSLTVSLPTGLEGVKLYTLSAFQQQLMLKQGDCGIQGVLVKPCKDFTDEDKYKIVSAIEKSFSDKKDSLELNLMEIVKLLVRYGADINQKDVVGYTALNYAANVSSGFSTVPLKYLIENGGNVNTISNQGGTPLHNAAAAGNRQAINILIRAGADTSIRNNQGLRYDEINAASKANAMRWLNSNEKAER